jgi:hypothetical protein
MYIYAYVYIYACVNMYIYTRLEENQVYAIDYNEGTYICKFI